MILSKGFCFNVKCLDLTPIMFCLKVSDIEPPFTLNFKLLTAPKAHAAKAVPPHPHQLVPCRVHGL